VQKVLQKRDEIKRRSWHTGVSRKITLIRMDGGYAMTGNQCKGRRINLQEIFGADKDSFKELLREVLQEVLEQEMTEAIGAESRAAGLSLGLP
jgi:hypothetical protein